MDADALLLATGIFFLRVVGNMITTLRLVLLVRGQKLSSTILSAFEALIFALALGSVVTNLENVLNLAAYCLGFAVGGYLGLSFEQRFIQRFVSVQIISDKHGEEIAQSLRRAGYGATETVGKGALGQVSMVTCVVGHQQVRDAVKIVQRVDPDVFVMLDELRGASHGYFRRLMRHAR